MPVDDHRPVDPPKPVEVRYRGIWVGGMLTTWRQDLGRWWAYVELRPR